jgi:hypothetical protein
MKSLYFLASLGLLLLLTTLLTPSTAQAQVGISIIPASTTYTAGQSVTVVITKGASSTSTSYSLDLFEGDPDILSPNYVGFYTREDAQGTNTDSFTFLSGQTVAYFFVRFDWTGTPGGSVGTNRVFRVTNDDFSDVANKGFTPGFEVKARPALNLALSPSSSIYTVGQPVSGTLTGGIEG